MIIFLIVFLTIYTSLNYYVFIRGWQVLSNYSYLKPYYTLLFIIVAYAYVAAKVFYKYLHPVIHDILIWVGSFWFAFLVYFILSLLVVDIVRFVGFKFNLLPQMVKNNYEQIKLITALIIIIFVTVTIILGYINTRKISVTKLEIGVPNFPSSLSELNIAMVSDIHLSPINDEKYLSGIVKQINELNPDIILMPGDIIDDRVEVLNRLNIGDAFKKLDSKYGVYASNGNHEFINEVESADQFMVEKGINVLRDSTVLIANSFYIAAREDKSITGFTGKTRKSLSSILANIDKSLPVILLDHTPVQLEEAESNSISLQLSGHTHHGQFFPGNIITNLIYEISHGYLKKSNTHYFVSCGAGTWGPPVRNVSNSEIVQILVKFQK
ncbi:metallophosphoesterase [Bacteroidota bacterium]